MRLNHARVIAVGRCVCGVVGAMFDPADEGSGSDKCWCVDESVGKLDRRR